MHRQLKALLHDAQGASNPVIAINLDVRGFSSFSKLTESADAAMFLRCVYIRLIDGYFSEASFFKPTGDGLLVIYNLTPDTVEQAVSNTVRTCLSILKDFSSFCDNDAMVNFDVPDKIGIGLARGAATSLVSKKKILDYSGRPLNLASRLMDLARPSGVVLDGRFGIEMLDADLAAQFTSETVYVRSLAEKEPIQVHYTSPPTVISPSNKQPLAEIRWHTDRETVTGRELSRRGPRFLHLLSEEPEDRDAIQVRVEYPSVDASGRKESNLVRTHQFRDFSYYESGTERGLNIDIDSLLEYLKSKKVKLNWNIEIIVEYPRA